MSARPTESSHDSASREQHSHDVIPLREATKAWFAISLQTFGGPAGQIAVMQRTLVDEKRWIGQQRFLFALNYCTLLPGPEAQQLATYVGWLLNGVRGALIAGILFVLPGRRGAAGALRRSTSAFGDTTLVESLFLGLAPGRHRHRHPGRHPRRQDGPRLTPPSSGWRSARSSR